jgi:zinc protease
MRLSSAAMQRLLLIAFLFLVVLGCRKTDQGGIPGAPDTTATAGPGEMLRDAGDHPGYGVESYRLISQPDEIVSVLKNGLTVVTKRVPSPVVSVRGYVMAGGVYEGKWLGGGLSHLLEHLVAGGTNDRRTEEQNRNLLQELGNNSNAYTYPDRTAFFVNTTNANAEKAVDLVTGWMYGAHITRAEYGREYMVVQRELEKDKGEADWVYYDLTNFNRYLVSPARVPVIGYQEVIQGLSRDDVYAYYRLAYVPNNMIFVVVGDRDPQELLAMVQKNSKDVKPGRAFSHNIEPEPPIAAPRTQVATFPKLGQARVQLGFSSVKLSSEDLYALDLLATVLGGGDSSIMNEEIRDKQQLATEILVSDQTPAFVEGTFAIDMKTDPKKLAEAQQAVLAVLERVKSEGVDEERVKRARSLMRTGSVYSRQTAETIAESLADGYISAGDVHFLDHYTDRIQKTDAKRLQEVARKYFDPQRLITTVMLPEEYVGAAGLPKAQDLVSAARGKAAATQTAAGGSPVERVVLDDGTVLLVKRMTASPIVSVNLFALGGVAAEDEKSNGLGNLAMEMLTRGTKTKSAQQIAETLDALGAQVETGCGNNSWFWKATCLKEDFPRLMEAYADVVNNPSFPQAELPAMKERVLAAIEGQDADWFALAMRFFRKTYFGPMKSPYQFMVLGTRENVTGFDRATIEKWYQQTILPRPRVLAIYGDVDVAQAKQVATQYLGKGPKREPVGTRTSAAAPPSKDEAGSRAAHLTVTRVEINKTNNPQAGVVIGFKADSVVGTPDEPALDVADCMTSGYGYPTGYIFEILRGRGLVYDANAKDFPGLTPRTPGTFFAYAGCEPKNVNECVDVILESIARLQGSPADVQADWFDRAKRLIVLGDAIDNETPSAQAQQAALDELYGLGCNFHAGFADRVNKVSLDQVRRLAATRLRECVVTISTPEPDKVTVKTGVRDYKSFPKVDLTPRGVQHDTGGGNK